MKKITFLALALLLCTFTVNADVKALSAGSHFRFSFEEPITFTERGVAFFIFPNGEFDFNTEPTVGNDIFYKRGNHGNNATHGAPGVAAGGIRIEHDALGRVRRIGNVFVNYDNANRVKRIGTVYLSYYRSALTQIGGMKLIYDRRGNLIDAIGNIKGNGQYTYQYQPATYYGPAQGYNQNDYYYYKADGTKVKIEEKERERR